jgi:hypothetical protein
VLRPGVPSVSTGFTAPSPFSRGATSAFGPVLQAASNYLNEITKTARLQNRMTMANMGGGGSAGSESNITVNGSVDSRNTNRVISANPNSAPLNENVNAINPDGTYKSFRNNVIAVNLDEFDSNASLATENLNKTAPQPLTNINYQDEIDQTNENNESVQVLADEDRDILANNEKQNENLNNLINQELKEEPLYDNDIWLFNTLDRANEETQERFLRKLREKGDLDVFEKGFNRWRAMGSPEANMAQVETSFKQNVANFLNDKMPAPTSAVQPPPVTPIRSPSSASSNFGPNDSVTSSSKGSTMYAPVSNAQNASSSSIGSKSGKQELRKFQSPLGDQDRQTLEQLKKNKKSPIPYIENIIPEDETVSDKSVSESDLNTEEQMEPSEYTEGSIPISSVSSKETRQSAVAARVRAKEVADANRRNKVIVVGGGGKMEIPKLRANIYENDPDIQNIRTEEDAIRVARMLGGQGYKSQAEQERLQRLAREQKELEEQQKKNVTNPISVENVFTPQVNRKKK